MTSVKEVKETGGKVVFGGVDVREKYGGGSGSGGGGRGSVKGKRREKEVCEVCMGVCCGAVRDLVCYLSNIRLNGVSSKVMIVMLF